MDNHGLYMEKALELANTAKLQGEIPVGAVVVYQGKIIGTGYNRREKEQSPTAHAEILAIEEAAKTLQSRRLTGCSLYVTLEPCPMCAGAMIMAQINQCFFGAYDQQQGCCGSIYNLPEDPAFYHRCPITGGIKEKEAQALLQDFFALKR